MKFIAGKTESFPLPRLITGGYSWFGVPSPNFMDLDMPKLIVNSHRRKTSYLLSGALEVLILSSTHCQPTHPTLWIFVVQVSRPSGLIIPCLTHVYACLSRKAMWQVPNFSLTILGVVSSWYTRWLVWLGKNSRTKLRPYRPAIVKLAGIMQHSEQFSKDSGYLAVQQHTQKR